MAKNTPQHEPVFGVEKQLLREAKLLVPPPSVRHSVLDLHRLVRLLLLAHGAAERQLLAYLVYHKLELRAAANAVGIPANRAQEIYDSLCLRVNQALLRAENEARLQDQKDPSTAPRQAGKPQLKRSNEHDPSGSHDEHGSSGRDGGKPDCPRAADACGGNGEAEGD